MAALGMLKVQAPALVAERFSFIPRHHPLYNKVRSHSIQKWNQLQSPATDRLPTACNEEMPKEKEIPPPLL